MQLFGTSGIRLKADAFLVQLALKLGFVLGRKHLRVVLGHDTRTSSPAVKHALLAGLNASGSVCFDAGLIPTPTLAFASRHFEAGIMITASHNPPDYNGIKLFNPDGSPFTDEQKNQIESAVLKDELVAAPWPEFTHPVVYLDAVEHHMQHILSDFTSRYPKKLVLDCGGGAGSAVTGGLLRLMGAEVIEINCEPEGVFPRPSEPLEQNLDELKARVAEFGADMGLAHDGDADRLMIIDNLGRFVSGDKLLVILARSLGARNVVTTVDASRGLEEAGFNVRYTPVGDNYISAYLKNWGEFGGEPSGSWVFPGVSMCPDGVYAAARLLSVINDNRLSDLVDALPSYRVVRGSIEGFSGPGSRITARLRQLNAVNTDETDGIRLTFNDGWLLVRHSGTEPKIRITAEGVSMQRAEELYDTAVNIIETVKQEGV